MVDDQPGKQSSQLLGERANSISRQRLSYRQIGSVHTDYLVSMANHCFASHYKVEFHCNIASCKGSEEDTSH